MWNWKDNKVVDSIESVPEKYRDLYTKVEEGDDAGKYKLSDAAAAIAGDVIGLTAAVAEERQKVANLNDESAGRRTRLAGFDEIFEDLGIPEGDDRTPENMKAKIGELRDKKGQAAQADLDRIREEMGQKHAKDLKAKEDEIAERDSAIAKHLIGDQATRAIAEAKGSVKALMPHVKDRCKVLRTESGDYQVRVYDEQGNVRYGSDANPMQIDELVQEYKADEAFSALFESETPSGGGMRPGSGATPPAKPQGEKSSLQKITDGIQNRQYETGGGRGQVA